DECPTTPVTSQKTSVVPGGQILACFGMRAALWCTSHRPWRISQTALRSYTGGMTAPADCDSGTPLTGRLYIFVAFDWGDEVDLDLASKLAPAAVVEPERRPRTPSSITYKPPPRRFRLGLPPSPLPGLDGIAVEDVEATVFDFAAVSVALRA